MSAQEIITIISTVGFPIACAVAMMWYVKYTTDKHREEVSELNVQHKQELSDVTEALNNNTLVIQKLCDKLDAKQDTISIK